MLKFIFIPILIVSLFACNPNKSATIKSLADSLHSADTSLKTIPKDRLIVPGKRVGTMRINGNADSLKIQFGRPDSGDAAMGAQLMTWFAKHNAKSYRTSVYSHRSMGGTADSVSRIKEIRVTSPMYKTTDYSGPGSMFKDVKKLYKFKRRPLNIKAKSNLYDDLSAGISFEVDSTGKCSAVIVHAPNDSLGSYLNNR